MTLWIGAEVWCVALWSGLSLACGLSQGYGCITVRQIDGFMKMLHWSITNPQGSRQAHRLKVSHPLSLFSLSLCLSLSVVLTLTLSVFFNVSFSLSIVYNLMLKKVSSLPVCFYPSSLSLPPSLSKPLPTLPFLYHPPSSFSFPPSISTFLHPSSFLYNYTYCAHSSLCD